MFNSMGDCVGIAFQSMAGGEAENIGYVIPTPVINHFLTDYTCAPPALLVMCDPSISEKTQRANVER